MNGPLAKLLLLTVVCGICLWFGVKWFVGGTDDLASTINVRSLSHLREGYQGSGSLPTGERLASNKITDPVSIGLARPVSTLDTPSQGNRELQEEQLDAADLEDESPAQENPETIDAEPIEVPADVSADEYVRLTDSQKLEQEELIASVSLGDDEKEARAAARRKRLADLGLLPKEPPAPTIAVDASLIMPENCKGAAIAKVPIGLKFRFESSLIKGESLNSLESLVALYRECAEGQFVLAQNPLGRTDATESLTQMRFDEIKYFFIQHSVSIDAVQFPEK